MKLMDVIRDKEKVATLIMIRDGAAMYKVEVEGKDYMFPIPVDEMASGTFLLEDKVRIFQRWIRKACEDDNLMPMF